MSVFRSDNNFIYLDADYCEFYIPMFFFDQGTNFAEDFGSYIDVLGIFNVGIFEKDKQIAMKTLNLPTTIRIQVYDSQIREVVLLDGSKTTCKIIKYFKGQKIMDSFVVEDSTNAQTYLNYITGGKLPSFIPYSQSLQIWRKNKELNGVHFGVASMIEELLLSVIYRNKDNLGEKFTTKITNDPNTSEFDYATCSIREICQHASTFSAITYEDFDMMLSTSINRAREKRPEMSTPLEDIIKY